MEVELRAGAKIDLLSQKELDHSLGHAHDREIRELARGVKWIRQAFADPLVPTHETILGPEQGFTWKLQRISATLTGADSISVYIGDAANNRLIGFTPSVTSQTTYVIPFSPGEIVNGGESLYVATSGNFRFTQFFLSAWQVPGEMIWKLL